MCPTPPYISTYWTDEEVCQRLDGAQRGFPLPKNVLAHANPYGFMPEHLPPGDIWYFVAEGEKKDAEIGFWKVTGEPFRVFLNNPSFDGVKTTLEFYKGKAPNACKTDWVMQEYRIFQKSPCENRKLEESSSLCRVFLSGGRSSSHQNQNLTAADGAGGGESSSGKEIYSRFHSQVQVNAGTISVSESERRTHHSAENMVENNYPQGDYLELLDLGSPSPSSENSSCVTLSSDECFDSLDLLQRLDDEINQDPQQKDADCKFNVVAFRHPDKVVLGLAKSESLSSNGDKSKLVANEITKADRSPPGLATKDNLLIEKETVRMTKTEDPKRRSKLVSNEITKADHFSPGSATKDNLLTEKVSSVTKTEDPSLRKEGQSARAKTSSSGSVSWTKANISQKKKCWIKNLCFFPF